MYPTTNAENLLTGKEPAAPVHRLYPAKSLSNPVPAVPHAPLQARLTLGFTKDAGATRLTERNHLGPLLVQKPLYPEGREVCQVVIVHPPGGVVGGDKLEVTAKVGPAASAQITTPGAAKWYKANGRVSYQNIKLDVGPGGTLEWVPQETIFFDNAQVMLDHSVALEKDASYIGCEILCFGRTASGESFTGGQIRQRSSIRRDGKLIWFEQSRLEGGSTAMKSPLVLSGSTVCATLIAVGKAVPAALLREMSEGADAIGDSPGNFGVTQFKSIIVMRYLGHSSEIARRIMLHAWGLLRPVMLNRQAMVPRLWNT
ncbi:urease accessory protein [Nitrosospira briensis]|uniref:Urease accessory protein UreD n=1 Tax=Nitrosospira briensis TaxID=35799 RepID=A0A1I4XZS4_9PROT|nr:urease accessory protein [Nitrosospira briensis]